TTSSNVSHELAYAICSKKSHLLRWVEPMATRHANIVLTHGEPHQMHQLAHEIHSRFGIKCVMPKIGETIEVDSRRCVEQATRV
ncbi:MAG: hypothetical protein K2Z81_13550, partial [Cyanobacteria bacterium]|nr:hypothetical protein [Cyanobacteriota bacterium]